MIRKLLPALLAALVLTTSLYGQEVSAPTGYRNAVKLTFLSWATGSTKISYERALPHRQSGEVCVSLISAGYDKYQNDPLGFTLRYGHKFFVGSPSDKGPLCGFYLRPEAIYSRYHYTPSDGGPRRLAAMGTLIASVGYQTTFGRLLVDGWFGGGPAVGIPAETGYHHGFQLWKWLGTRNDNVAMSFSIRIGYCF